MDVLSDVIINMDDLDQSILSHPEVKEIEVAVESYAAGLLDAICKKSDIYTGYIVGAGSYYDDLKVGAPNEFDFNVVLTDFVYEKNFILKSSGYNGKRNLWGTNGDSPIFKKVLLTDVEFSNRWHGNDKTINVGTLNKLKYILSQLDVKIELEGLIDEVLNSIDLSESLSVIGVVDMSGPAISIDLKWNGRKFKDLIVNIDISLVIDIPNYAAPIKPKKLFPLDHPLYQAMEEYVANKNCYAIVPFVDNDNSSSGCWRISSGYLESFLFDAFEKDDNVKRLIRFMKQLRDMTIDDNNMVEVEVDGQIEQRAICNTFLLDTPNSSQTVEQDTAVETTTTTDIVMNETTSQSPSKDDFTSSQSPSNDSGSSSQSQTKVQSTTNKIISKKNSKSQLLWDTRKRLITSTYVFKQILFYMLRETNVDQANNENIAYRFIQMLKQWFLATKKGGKMKNFFIEGHQINVSIFEDCYESFVDVMIFIKNTLDVNKVAREDRVFIWEELRDIYKELKKYYDRFELDEEYENLT